MTTRILFFGSLKEIAGGGEKLADLPATVKNTAALVDWLAGGNDDLKRALNAAGVRVAVDRSLIDRKEPFDRPAEIAFMPPFSGG